MMNPLCNRAHVLNLICIGHMNLLSTIHAIPQNVNDVKFRFPRSDCGCPETLSIFSQRGPAFKPPRIMYTGYFVMIQHHRKVCGAEP